MEVKDNWAGLSKFYAFKINVLETNQSPTISGVPLTVDINEQVKYSFTAVANDPDIPAQSVTYSLDSLAPEFATIGSSSGVFEWTPSEADGPFTHFFHIMACDNNVPPDCGVVEITINVKEVNLNPTLSGVPTAAEAEVGKPFTFTAVGKDVDVPAQRLSYSISGLLFLPPGSSIDPQTGVFTWTPRETDLGKTYSVLVIVNDTLGGSATQALSLRAIPQNHAPLMTNIPATAIQINEESQFLFGPNIYHPDFGQSIYFYFDQGSVIPSGLTLNHDTGQISWTPTETQGPGEYNLTLWVCDNHQPTQGCSSGILKIAVNEVNQLPVLSGVPGSADLEIGKPFSFTAVGTDPDLPAQALSYFTIGTLPANASFDQATGSFTWTPAAADSGITFSFSVGVRDSLGMSATKQVNLKVVQPNRLPVLTNLPPIALDVFEGSPFAFKVQASDADTGQLLSFSFSQGWVAPSGLTLNAATGELLWTPSEAQGPSENIIPLTVCDNAQPTPGCANGSLTVTVKEVNASPSVDRIVVSGDLRVGNILSFEIFASDADLPAQSLSYKVFDAAAKEVYAGTAASFTYTPTAQGQLNLKVIVTDNGTPALSGEKGFSFEILPQEGPITGSLKIYLPLINN